MIGDLLTPVELHLLKCARVVLVERNRNLLPSQRGDIPELLDKTNAMIAAHEKMATMSTDDLEVARVDEMLKGPGG